MPLNSPSRLGPYEIERPIGAGGMGEVYEARDTRLGRVVAIKILPVDRASSAPVKERFVREAKAISQLNHPHICTLYDVGEHDGTDYLVMERLEGETLGERLRRGALPLDTALEYAVQIADALDSAHRAGIVHRDLKPANVIVQKSGVKLLDFGLAKLVEASGEGDADLSDAPTRQHALTEDHAILGTLQYMAPEQLEGKAVDARADVFAFGAVLTEMITGRAAFAGESQAGLMSAILGGAAEPLPASLPRGLQRFVDKCLAKSPEDRWQTARDVVTELEWIRAQPEPAEPAPRESSRPRAPVVWLALGLVVGGLAAATWMRREVDAPASPPSRLTRFTIALPEGQRLAEGQVSPIALSPDGTALVYAADIETGSRLYLRSLDAFEPTPIAGTEGGHSPFFSPDGEWIGFFTDTQLLKVALGGGEPTPLAPVDRLTHGGSWGPDGTIVFFGSGNSRSLMKVSSNGGSPEPLNTGKAGRGISVTPQIFPDGDTVLALDQMVSIAGKPFRYLDFKGSAESRVYVPSGHLLFASGGSALSAQGFDYRTGRLRGEPVQVLTGVASGTGGRTGARAPYVATSANGTLAYVSGAPDRNFFVRVDRAGDASALTDGEPVSLHTPRLSPDGSRIAYDGRDYLGIYDIVRKTLTELRPNSPEPAWSPDGRELAYGGTVAGGGPFGLFVRPADGSQPGRMLLAREHPAFPSSWSAEGLIAFTEMHPNTLRDIWVLSPDGDAMPFLATEAEELAAVFSPDGRYLAYQSDVSGTREIYVRPYPELDARWQISSKGGTAPVWSPAGGELFYRQGRSVMVVDVVTGEDFSAGPARVLFDGDYVVDNTGHPGYDVAPDGQSFLMIQQVREAPLTEIHVVLDWLDELERQVPTKD